MSIYLCSAARRTTTTTTTTTTTQPLLLVVPTTAFFPISPPSRLLPRSPPAAYYSSASYNNPRGVLHSSSSFCSSLTAQKKNIYPPRGILPLRVQRRFNSTITDATTTDMSSSAKKEFLVIIPDKPGVGAKRIEVRP